jgi:phage-related protein
MKGIKWLGDSLQVVREFSPMARGEAGHQLHRVQNGKDPEDWKPMPSIGMGVKEIRIHAENEYRVIYVAKFSDAVYVIHAFPKKTQRTSQKDIDLAAKRYRELVNLRTK